MKTLKEHLVNNKIIIPLLISTIVLSSCVNKDNKDIVLLKTYFNDYKQKSKEDSIFFGLNNYNGEAFKTYERYLKLKNEYPLDEIFLKEEYDNFKNQEVDGVSVWNIDLSIFEGVYQSANYLDRKDLTFLYVSKPVYTIDGKYALIYHRNGTEDVYFISSIKVYENKGNNWIKISEISRY